MSISAGDIDVDSDQQFGFCGVMLSFSSDYSSIGTVLLFICDI